MTPFLIQKTGKFRISDFYKQSKLYFYPYARQAFFEVIKTLKIKNIYLPSFICRDMLAPLNILKIKYTFYEVNEKLEPIIKNIKCDAILMVDYFGFSQDIKPFLKYKKKYKSLIIEDNAHGFLSRDKNSELLGTREDIGLLSIRKTFFLPNGGALLVNNLNLKKKHFENSKIKNTDEDTYFRNKYFLKRIIFNKYIGIMILLIRRFIRLIKTGSPLPLPDNLSEERMPSNNFLTPLLENGKLSIDIESETKRRRDLYVKIKEYGEKFNIKPIYELEENTVPFQFAFIDKGNYKQFEQFLYKKGFFILPWPDLPSSIIDTCPNFYKNVKVVPFLW